MFCFKNLWRTEVFLGTTFHEKTLRMDGIFLKIKLKP